MTVVQNYTSLIRDVRKRMGLNVREFGLLIGVSGRTIEGWEQGRRKPGKPTLLLIKKIMEVEDVKDVDSPLLRG